MMTRETEQLLLIATDDGLVISNMDGRHWSKTLAGVEVTSVIAREGVILAGTADGVWRSDDGGGTWVDSSDGLGDRRIRWLAFHPQISDLELAGTAADEVFVSRDGARSWRLLDDGFVWVAPLRAGGAVLAVATMS